METVFCYYPNFHWRKVFLFKLYVTMCCFCKNANKIPEFGTYRVRSSCMCDALRDLISLVQFKKREKHPWRSFKSSTPPWVFFTCFKLYQWCQIAQNITYKKLTAFLYYFTISQKTLCKPLRCLHKTNWKFAKWCENYGIKRFWYVRKMFCKANISYPWYTHVGVHIWGYEIIVF